MQWVANHSISLDYIIDIVLLIRAIEQDNRRAKGRQTTSRSSTLFRLIIDSNVLISYLINFFPTRILLAYCTPPRALFNRAPVTELSFERSNVIIRIYHVRQVCPTAIVMIKHTGSCFSNVEIFIIHQSILHCVRTCRQRQVHTHKYNQIYTVALIVHSERVIKIAIIKTVRNPLLSGQAAVD